MSDTTPGTRVSLVEGDLHVGRDINLGGKFTSQGSGRVNGNLDVYGYLDARHLKNVCKGLFSSLEDLSAEYPFPRKGWYAYVGNSLPAAVYIVENGEWTASGETGGEEYVDLPGLRQEFTDADNAIRELIDSLVIQDYVFRGMAFPDTEPEDGKFFYIAYEPGAYLFRRTGIGSQTLVIESGTYIIYYMNASKGWNWNKIAVSPDDIVQETGDSEEKVMSQSAVTNAVNGLQEQIDSLETGGGGGADLSDYYTKSEVDARLQDEYYTQVDTKMLLSDYNTKGQARAELVEHLESYYTKAETEVKLQAEYYTKSEVDARLGDYYTEAETRIMLGDGYYTKSEVRTLLDGHSSSRISRTIGVGHNSSGYYTEDIINNNLNLGLTTYFPEATRIVGSGNTIGVILPKVEAIPIVYGRGDGIMFTDGNSIHEYYQSFYNPMLGYYADYVPVAIQANSISQPHEYCLTRGYYSELGLTEQSSSWYPRPGSAEEVYYAYREYIGNTGLVARETITFSKSDATFAVGGHITLYNILK